MDFRFIQYEDHSDARSASLGVIELNDLGFLPKRAYWLSNFVPGTSRGKHAHKHLNQIMIMIKGSLDLLISDGTQWHTVEMIEKGDYVFLPAGHWREMRNASNDAVLLVLADAEYLEDDYIRDWQEYMVWISKKSV